MRKHAALNQYALLLVEHGTQQVVGVERALHQHLGSLLAHLLYGKPCGIVVVGSHDDVYILGIVGCKAAGNGLLAFYGNECKLCEVFADATLNHLLSVRVGRRCHGNHDTLSGRAYAFG